MRQDTVSPQVRMLVDQFLDDDGFQLIPWHLMGITAVARLVGDTCSTILAFDDRISEEELLSAVVDAFVHRVECQFGVTINQAISGSDASLDQVTDWCSSWWPCGRPARREIGRIADASGVSWEAALRTQLKTALFEAFKDIDRPQTHRWGRSWEKGPDGKKAESSPWDHSTRLALRWLRKDVRNRMEAALLGDSSATRSVEDDEPLDILLDQQRIDEIYELAARFGRASISKKTLMLFILTTMRGKTGAEASRLLGMTPEAGRVRLFRFYRDYPELDLRK